jgi:hypothetical protein
LQKYAVQFTQCVEIVERFDEVLILKASKQSLQDEMYKVDIKLKKTLGEVDNRCEIISGENKAVEKKLNNFMQLISSQIDAHVGSRVKKEY